MKEIIQQKPEANRAVLILAKALQFPMPAIRSGLLRMNQISPKKMDGVPSPTLYNAVSGNRQTKKAQELIASVLGLEVGELFPPDEKPLRTGTGSDTGLHNEAM